MDYNYLEPEGPDGATGRKKRGQKILRAFQNVPGPLGAIATQLEVQAANRQERKKSRMERVRQHQEGRRRRRAMKEELKDARLKGRLEKQAARTAAKVAKYQNKISEDAAAMQQDPADIAIRDIESNPRTTEKIKNYIQEQGETPVSDNPAELATQASMLRNEEVDDVQNALEQSYLEDGEEEPPSIEEAEQFCCEMDFEQYSSFDPSADNFIDPVTWAAISAAGKKGIDLLANKQFKNGKKFLGYNKQQWDAVKQGKQVTPDPGQEPSPINQVIDAGVTGYKSATIEGMIPVILVAVIVIFMLGSHSGK